MSVSIKIWKTIQRLDRLVFTTRELSASTGLSISSTSQGLSKLEGEGVLKRVMQGVWAMVGDRRFSPFMLVPFLSPAHQNYVSFISAMHIYGMISQIPQTVTVASTAHTKKIATPVATFSIHQIDPYFFAGFDWHKNGHYLIATPEKAWIDCLYISSRRGKRYASFPEVEFPHKFSIQKARKWADEIRDTRLRKSVIEKFEKLKIKA